MAKVIEVYIPKIFRKPPKWVPAEQLGALIEFVSQGRKFA